MFYLFFDNIPGRCFCKLTIDNEPVGFGFADSGFTRVLTSTNKDFFNIWPDDIDPIYDNGYLLGLEINEELPSERYNKACSFIKKIKVTVLRPY